MNDARVARPTLIVDLGALRRNWLMRVSMDIAVF